MVPLPHLDDSLLSGFGFECRPECGLCCFAEPAVTSDEGTRLLERFPGLQLLPQAHGFDRIASRPRGGACALLRGLRCTAHDLRPFPCRTFPLTAHLGDRVQVAVVLSCPGVDLGSLGEATPIESSSGARGLEAELDAIRRELASPDALDRIDRARRQWLRWAGALGADGPGLLGARGNGDVVRRVLRALHEFFPAPLPPSRAGGLDSLPLTYDDDHGRIGFAQDSGQVALLAFNEETGGGEVLGRYPPPEEHPSIAADGLGLLDGYLRYVANRDSFLGQALERVRLGDDRDLRSALYRDLGWVAAGVLTRATLLERLHGQAGATLDRAALEAGIRAMDAEVLDRPTVGDVL